MLRALLAAFLLAAPAAAQNAPLWPTGWKPLTPKSWGGLNLLQDSSMIGGDAQEAVNVLTDNTYLEKRPGNTLLATILPGYSVQYVGEWSAPNGSRYLVAQASQTVYQTNFSGSPVALSTIAAGFNVVTAPAFSRLEFADGFRPLWYWDDVSTHTVTDATTGSVAPVCTYILFKDNRIWCANLPNGFTVPGNTTNGGGSSTVLISSKNADGYWAVPVNVGQQDDAPNRFDFNPNDGDQITCFAATPWGVFIGKRNSSYVIKGNGNLSYDPRILDPKIGCVDNRSVQMDYGVLKWLAVDGVYGWDGSASPQLLSRELDPLMASIRESTFSQGQWATQLLADWQSGTASSGTNNVPANAWDSGSLPGQVFPSSATLYDDNTSPSLQNCTTATNPQNSLPWNCGVGFSSDTLVNIDTVTAPLSVGYAQLKPSASGIQVWVTSFTGTNYTATQTTWTVSTADGFGNCDYSAQGLGKPFNGTCQLNYLQDGQIATLYTMDASLSTAPTNGWHYGYWSIGWYPITYTGGPTYNYGWCHTASPTCFEYDFMADRKVEGSWNGYGISVAPVSSCPGNVCTYTATLFKSIAGIKTTLGTGTFNLNLTNSYVGFSTMSVTRTEGGGFTVWNGLTPILTAQDNTPAATVTKLSAVTLGEYSHFGQGGAGVAVYNALFTANLLGYGSGSITSRIVDTNAAAPLAGQLTPSATLTGDGATSVTYKVRSSTSPNNDLWNSYTAYTAGQVPTNLNRRYWQYEADFATTVASETPKLTSLLLPAVTTGYYYSNVDFVGSLITSWRQFGVTEANPGVYNYWVREATYNFSAADTSIPWVAQTANQNVNLTVSTPTYAQFRLDSNPLVNNSAGASAAEPVTAVFVRWNQGANLPVASAAINRRYLLCVTVSTSAAAPDRCLLQQKNGRWVEWNNGGTIGAVGLYNSQMVAADGGTSSKVWQILQPGVYQDDGQAISSSWVGADEDDGLPFNQKTYFGTLVDAQPVVGSSVTASYAVDRSTGYVASTFSLDNGQGLNPANPVSTSQYGSLSKWLPPTTGYDSGKFLRFKFSDATLNGYFRINSYTAFVHDEGWTPP